MKLSLLQLLWLRIIQTHQVHEDLRDMQRSIQPFGMSQNEGPENPIISCKNWHRILGNSWGCLNVRHSIPVPRRVGIMRIDTSYPLPNQYKLYYICIYMCIYMLEMKFTYLGSSPHIQLLNLFNHHSEPTYPRLQTQKGLRYSTRLQVDLVRGMDLRSLSNFAQIGREFPTKKLRCHMSTSCKCKDAYLYNAQGMMDAVCSQLKKKEAVPVKKTKKQIYIYINIIYHIRITTSREKN